jgi:hypothetical protein
MTPDDIWDLAIVDPSLAPGKRAELAQVLGLKAALRAEDKVSAANEGRGSQPAEASQSVDEDAVMEDLVPVSYISISRL